MTEGGAQREVELRHGRRLFVEPVSTALPWGLGTLMVLLFLNGTELATINGWVATAVAAAVGFGFWNHNRLKNLQMRDEVRALLAATGERSSS